MATSMFIDVLIVGVMVGAIYTLVTIGYSMVYGMLKLMNFAHGDVYIFQPGFHCIHARYSAGGGDLF